MALAILGVLSGGIIFLPPELGRWATAVPITALFPLLLWIAARCGPVFAAVAAFIVALAIVCTTTFGIGIRRLSEELRELAAEHGFPQYLAIAAHTGAGLSPNSDRPPRVLR